MGDLASPISAFLRDMCVLEPLASVPAAVLYEAWRSWCQEHGRDVVGDEAAFGRDLHAAIPELSKSRLRKNSVRVVHYTNIRLRTPLDPDQEPEIPRGDSEPGLPMDGAAETPF
jgi:putative DNA primase/helicase